MTRKDATASPPTTPPRPAFLAALLLSAAGLVVALVLVRLHLQAHAGVASFCAINDTVNCDKVALSPWSVVLGVPVAVWGALGYAAALLLSAWGLARRRLHAAWPAGLLLVVGVAATAVSTALALVSALVIGAWCLVCMASWAVTLALLVTAVVACRGPGLLGALRLDLRALAARPRATSLAILVGLAGLLALVTLYPPAGEPPVAAAGPAGPQGAGAAGQVARPPPPGPLRDPALGAVVYSDYECPYCLVAHRELRAALARRPDIKVVKRHFPLDQACNPVVKRPMHRDACEYARAAICAEAQGHFEAMDDALFQIQRGRRPVVELARGLGLDLAGFQACLGAPETEERLRADIAAALKDGVKATPTYVVGGVQHGGRLPVELFQPAR